MEKHHNKSPAETGRFTPRMPCKRDCEQWAQRRCCLGQQDVPHPFPATCPQYLDRNIITRYYSAPRAKQPRWRPRRSAEVSDARRLSHCHGGPANTFQTAVTCSSKLWHGSASFCSVPLTCIIWGGECWHLQQTRVSCFLYFLYMSKPLLSLGNSVCIQPLL